MRDGSYTSQPAVGRDIKEAEMTRAQAMAVIVMAARSQIDNLEEEKRQTGIDSRYLRAQRQIEEIKDALETLGHDPS